MILIFIKISVVAPLLLMRSDGTFLHQENCHEIRLVLYYNILC